MVRIPTPFVRHLVHETTGSHDAIGNYSAAAVRFVLRPAPGVLLEMTKLIVAIEDTGNLVDNKYGDTNGALLANGMTLTKQDADGVLQTFVGDHAIKSNEHWGHLDFDYTTLAKNASPHGNVRWRLDEGEGVPLRLDGDKNEMFAITLEDDFSFLVLHEFIAHGIVRKGADGWATDGWA